MGIKVYNIVVTFKVDKDMYEQLNAYAIKHRMSKAEVIRLALNKLFEEEKKNEENLQIKIEKGPKLWR
jgi:metal-responsive CopG/Arc/MetJ family transcriptional regulator